MSKKTSVLILIIVTLVNIRHLRANDFAPFELGARAATLGGAFVARADDVSAVYYNPAGMAFMGGIRFKVNMLFNFMKTNAYDLITDRTYKSDPMQIQGAFYLTLQLLDRLTFGMGYFNPYLNDMEWPSNWPGDPLCIEARLSTSHFRSTLAVKVVESFSVALGVDLVFARLDWRHAQIFPLESNWNYGRVVDSRYETKGTGLGFVAGLLWKTDKGFQIGARYKHKVRIDLEGENRYFYRGNWGTEDIIDIPNLESYPLNLARLLREFYVPQDVTSRVTLPAELVLGIMITPIHRCAIQLDFQWTGWGEFGNWEFRPRDWGEDVNWDFIQKYNDSFGEYPKYDRQGIELNWKDTWSIKFGLEFCVSKVIALRTGYAYSPSALKDQSPTAIHPELNHHIISFGLGYEGPLFSIWDYEKTGGLSFDAFFQYMISKEQTSSLPGFEFSYDADRWVVGIGVGFNF